ncbi:hypothetical protein D1872_314930 [compost metagenome]
MKQTPPLGKRPYLTEEEQQGMKRMIIESTPTEEGFGLDSCWNTRILQCMIEDKFAVTMSQSRITGIASSPKLALYTAYLYANKSE